MTFEEALRTELISISELNCKAFPLVAPQKTDAPFCVYRKSNIKFHKNMNGTTPKAEALYEITLVTKTYEQLQQISHGTIDKIISFLGRRIGDAETGPYIGNLSVEIIGDSYEPEIDMYSEVIQLKVNY